MFFKTDQGTIKEDQGHLDWIHGRSTTLSMPHRVYCEVMHIVTFAVHKTEQAG